MRPIHRLLAGATVLALAVGMLAAPAAADRDAPREARLSTRSVVHAGPAGPAQARPTSFDVAAPRSRPAAALRTAPVAHASSPSVFFGFDALADLDGFFPSDTVGALGDSVYVTAVNSSIGIFSAADGSVVVPRTSLESMNPLGAGLLVFDPKVVYDPYEDVFVVVWLGFDDSPQTSVIFATAIPDATASNPATWCSTAFAGDQVSGDGAQWADYPGLGYNGDRVTITTNQFSFSNAFRYSQVMTIDKLGLYDCSQPVPVPVVFAGASTSDQNGIPAFTMQPAQTVGASPGAQLLLSFQCFPLSCFTNGSGKDSYLTIWRIKSTASGLTLKKGTVPTGKVLLPLPGTQGGGVVGGSLDPDFFWDAGDERLVNVFYDADRDELFTAHAVFKNLTPDPVTGGYEETVARWYEIDPATKLKNSVIERKGIVGSPEVDSGWPTLATDDDGNLFVTFNRASAPLGEFLSAWVAEIHPNSTSATQSLMQSGFARYDVVPGIERWGDYTGINRDPVISSSMATFNQYALSTTSWQQVVHAVEHA
jgi:hypothetical protein